MRTILFKKTNVTRAILGLFGGHTVVHSRHIAHKSPLKCEQLEMRCVPAGFDFSGVQALGTGTAATSIAEEESDAAGNTYIRGYFEGTVDFDPTHTLPDDTDLLTSVGPGRDLFIAKYDPQKVLLWAKRMGSESTVAGQEELSNDFALSQDGSLYLTGYFYGTFQIDELSLTSAGDRDGFLVKINGDGSTAWATRWGTSLIENGEGVAVGSNGEAYVVGDQDIDQNATGGSVEIMQFDADNGDMNWSRVIQSGSYGVSVGVDPLGYVNIASSFSDDFDADPGPGTTILTHGERTRAVASTYLIQLDGQGDFRWARAFEMHTPVDPSFVSFAFAQQVLVDPEGHTIIVGEHGGRVDFNPDSTNSLELGETARAFAVKLDRNGSLVWAGGVSGSGNYFFRDVSLDRSGNLLAAGYLRGYGLTIDFDPGPGIASILPLNASSTNFDGFIWSLTATGEFRSITHLGTANASTQILGLAVGSDNGLQVVGSFVETVDFDPGPGVHSLTTVARSGFQLQLSARPGITIDRRFGHVTSEAGQSASIAISLDSPPTADVFIPIASSDPTEGTLNLAGVTFTSANWNQPQVVIINGVNDSIADGTVGYSINFGESVSSDAIYNGLTTASIALTNLDNDIPTTKFYVVDDASANRTYEYTETGASVENYSLTSGNTAPRGAASTVAGTTVWVVDTNKKVYVYNDSGALLGSWTAGSLASNATVEGITVHGNDVWLVDARQDKVFRYAGAATRRSGSQNAAGSFNLNSGNASPMDLVTDGTSIWVVNDASTDKVFQYTMTGSLLGSWTISGGGGSPTGITLDPSNSQHHLWIVDRATDRVYQFDNARSKVSGSQAASLTFNLAIGNSNPQGIADPPAPNSLRSIVTAIDSTTGTDTALQPMTNRLATKHAVATLWTFDVDANVNAAVSDNSPYVAGYKIQLAERFAVPQTSARQVSSTFDSESWNCAVIPSRSAQFVGAPVHATDCAFETDAEFDELYFDEMTKAKHDKDNARFA